MIRETYHRNKAKLEVEGLDDAKRVILIFDFDKKRLYNQDGKVLDDFLNY